MRELKTARRVVAVHYRLGGTTETAHRYSVIDEDLSPFSELFSYHGSSETDEEHLTLRRNRHMGPAMGPGTYQSALDSGIHIGAIASTDGWSLMPARYGDGLMACLAGELSRDGLWEAFKARRVYGVTGDRIGLDFRLNGHPMGSRVTAAGKRRIAVNVIGSDAIDRIEILKNGRVIATHCHQGAWSQPRPGRRRGARER